MRRGIVEMVMRDDKKFLDFLIVAIIVFLFQNFHLFDCIKLNSFSYDTIMLGHSHEGKEKR